MGLFDTVNYRAVCPGCGRDIPNFQTKELECLMDEYQRGDSISTPRLKVLVGILTAYNFCDSCEKMVYLDIVIENGVLGRVLDTRLEKKNESDKSNP